MGAELALNHSVSRVYHQCGTLYNSGYSPLAKIRTLAAYERARRALRGECAYHLGGILPSEQNKVTVSINTSIRTKLNASGNTPRLRRCGSESSIPRQRKEKRPPSWWSFFFGRGIGIRTPTYRVRVCCAAVTQFPCAITDYILAHIISFVNSFFEFCLQYFLILLLKIRARYVIMSCVIYSGVRERWLALRIS